MTEFDCCRSWDLALSPLVWRSCHQWKEQEEREELAEDLCCKEPPGRLDCRTGMVQGLGRMECGHRKDPGLKPSRCLDDCLGCCAGDVVD